MVSFIMTFSFMYIFYVGHIYPLLPTTLPLLHLPDLTVLNIPQYSSLTFHVFYFKFYM